MTRASEGATPRTSFIVKEVCVNSLKRASSLIYRNSELKAEPDAVADKKSKGLQCRPDP
jgi:hypothetical protein